MTHSSAPIFSPRFKLRSAAHRINQCLFVGRQSQARDRLAVVRTVLGYLTGSVIEVRVVRDPHVADPLCIEDPRDTAAVVRAHKLAGERRTGSPLWRKKIAPMPPS